MGVLFPNRAQRAPTALCAGRYNKSTKVNNSISQGAVVRSPARVWSSRSHFGF